MDEINEDEISKRHKQERKDLQAKIQSLKKSVTKGDKKKKKEIIEEIARLEQELEAKQTLELESVTSLETNNVEKVVTEIEIVPPVDEDEDEEPQTIKISRASRRRNKKAQEEKERERRIQEQAVKNKEGPRITELNAMSSALKELGLQLHNIPADGNCLYCAVNHQLETTGREIYNVAKLRKLTADFMREHKEDFLPFMYNESDEPVSEEYFESYCKEVATTKLWGGQLELKALSNIFKCPIKIIQANAPPTVQGETFEGPELILAYHRHLYRLGEHYNSTIALCDDEDENCDSAKK